MKKNLLIGFFVTLFFSTWAQNQTVRGKVTSAEDGSPLPGVNILLKGTTTGTVTTSEGTYSIAVPGSGGMLVFSFIGLLSQEIEIAGRSTIDVQMTADAKQLTEVVVTALGIERSAKSLPYAAQTVNADQLNMTRANNINDALAGKVSGIQVRSQSGAALDRGATIRIRGAGSLGDKEPLYVLDGTPVNSQDINPDDIENISVLKGPTAAALYGQRGDAGVIVMTTKKGRGQPGLGISASNNTFFERVYILPEYQNSYAGGAFPDLVKFTWQDGMPEEWRSLDGEYYPDYTDDGSWGPRMVGQDYIPWYAWVPGTKYTGKTAKLVGQPGNVRDFYETGVNSTTNFTLSKAADHYNARLSYTDQSVKGVMPFTGKHKRTLSTQFSYDLGKVVTVGGNINYVTQNLTGNSNDDGYANQSTGTFNQWFHRDLDMNIMKELADLKSPGGRLVSWNHFNPTSYLVPTSNGYGDKFYNGYYWWSPYTYFKYIDYENSRDRLFGDVNVRFHIANGISLTAYYRKNQRTVFWENKRPTILPYSFQTELRPTGEDQWDYYGTGQIFQKEDNLELIGTLNKSLMDGRITIDLNAGGNLRMEKYNTLQGNTLLGLVVPDLYTLSNSKSQYQTYNFRSRKEVRSLYARGSFGYNNTVFLEWSARNDWSSALPDGNNSYFYPMIGTSFVFSEVAGSALPFLSMGKVRASWAQVGSDLDPYQTRLLYSTGANQWNGNLTMATPDELVDPGIKPALSSSFEAGIDLNFLNNVVRFSGTFYQETKKDEILSVDVTGASGFTQKKINAGKLERHGIELQIDATPIRTRDIMWNVTLNWARNRSEIKELVPGVTSAALLNSDGDPVTSTFSQVSVLNQVDKGWGQIVGTGIKRIDGKPVIDDHGLYVIEQNKNFGSVLPDFTGGFINQITYKQFSLMFNIDFQNGGKFYSLSDMWLNYSGLSKKSASLNDKGSPVRSSVEDGGGVHVVGVNEEGAAVDMYVDAKTYFQQGNGLSELSTYDLTFIKMREINIGYQIPVQKTPLGKVLKTASISFVARNFWLIYSDVNGYDPGEIAAQFGENGQFPGTRSYGFNLKVGL